MPSNPMASKTVNKKEIDFEKPKLRIKGLTDSQFYNQPGLCKKRQYMTENDFKNIFGS